MALWLATLKSLLAVAAVTGGYPVPRAREGSLGALSPDYAVPAAKTDIFERGAWWKNRIRSQVRPLDDVRRCAYGDCRERALKAYGDQVSVFRQTVAVVGAREPVKVSSPKPRIETLEEADEEKKKAAADEKNARARYAAGEGKGLDSADRLLLARLRSIDAVVRRHEQAHLTVAASLVRGAANYQYIQGPDGKRYAIGGDVSIDVAKDVDPGNTINKMERVRAAALAPAVPSAQDRRVAVVASLVEMTARRDLKEQEMAELEEKRHRSGAVSSGRVVSER